MAQSFSSSSSRKAWEGFRGQTEQGKGTNTVGGLAKGQTQTLYKHVMPSDEAVRTHYVPILQIRKLRLG